MAVTEANQTEPTPTGAEEVAWDVESLVDGGGGAGAVDLVEQAIADAIELTDRHRGTVGDLDAPGLADLVDAVAGLVARAQRAGSYASLRFSVDTADPTCGALMQQVQEKAAELQGQLVWFELEWVAIDDERATELLAAPELRRHRHHLEVARLAKPHVLTEPEEKLLAALSPTGRSAWVRLFTEQTSAIDVDLDGTTTQLMPALSRLHAADRGVRRSTAAAVTEALAPGLRTRAYVYNTLAGQKATEDRLRGYPTWITSWNHGNETTDESVQALVDAVVSRYDIPQRWYRLKGRVLGIDDMADYDRYAAVGETESFVPWEEATRIVRDAYASFSPELARGVDRFLDEGWIDAPVRPGKRGGAFCSYTVPDHHPYVFLNYTATPNDVLTLAHELGHGLHGYLARDQGVFQQMTPLTVAETASVFGEAVTFERLLAQVDDPAERFALLAQNVEGNIATVFRQVAMNRFEDAVHTHRRTEGELSVEDFNGHWARTQQDLFGEGMTVSEGYRSWWSYVPHFIGTPGYVYAYAYGQLLALSVYANYRERGEEFVPAYLELLATGGSRWPTELARIVDCDLDDPGFWAAGLELLSATVDRAEAAAIEAGRL